MCTIFRVYDCFHCSNKYSELKELRAHLRSTHSSEWPWICGFCDQLLLYELEFRLHVKGHTEEGPHPCPHCDGRSFADTDELRRHLCEGHMPRGDDANTSGEINVNMLTDKKKNKAAADSTESAATASATDENAVNREIAALLLNLHASRSSADVVAAPPAKAEDLTVKADTAMDLTKTKSSAAPSAAVAAAAAAAAVSDLSALSAPLPASISKLAKNIDMKGTTATSLSLPSVPSSSSASLYSSFYPSLASMGINSTTLASMNSNYLLQNLLLGKMQQMVSTTATSSTSTSSSSASSSPLSFPTQPIPAQALSIPSTTSLKPPASVLKSPPTAIPVSSTNGVATSVSLPTVPNFGSSIQQQLATASGSAAASATNIPLLCGQIVAQLNGLLFLVHSLNSSHVEATLQTQLSAIYTRLQEVVAMVEQAKKEQEDKRAAQQQLEKKQKAEEDKIAKHIQDYQRALLKQQEQAKIPAQIAPLKETTASTDVINLLKKQAQQTTALDAKHIDQLISAAAAQTAQDAAAAAALAAAEPTSTAIGDLGAAARRRRGRPPKNSNSDLTYSPPEKRSRGSVDSAGSGSALGMDVDTTTGLIANGSTTEDLNGSAINGSSGKTGSGKGIRNRVFCGECSGCLKNDDCGRCRYCQDKTKFGGQNRLRQKCLHRRCQMDTNRKRNTNGNGAANGSSNSSAVAMAAAVAAAAAAAGGVTSVPTSLSSFADANSARHSPSPNAIYSGVDLARLAATAAAAEKMVGESVAAVQAAAAAAAVASAMPGVKQDSPATIIRKGKYLHNLLCSNNVTY